MAEQIAVYEGRLPGKSRMAPGSTLVSTAASAQKHPGAIASAALTVPISPQFETKKRVRAPRFKPREVVEAEEMAAMPKFKARPVK
jgi:targeting protein for Xklp2